MARLNENYFGGKLIIGQSVFTIRRFNQLMNFELEEKERPWYHREELITPLDQNNAQVGDLCAAYVDDDCYFLSRIMRIEDDMLYFHVLGQTPHEDFWYLPADDFVYQVPFT